MVDSLRELTEAISVLEDEGRVLELAARVLWEECPRGVAIAGSTRGEQAQGMGQMRVIRDGALIPLSIPHTAYAKTPAFDVGRVPDQQRNRWVEPFREGIATLEGFKKSTIYPFVARLGVLDQGRIAVCSAERMVAMGIVGVPEGTSFADDERERLVRRAPDLVVPLRVAALLAGARRKVSSIDALLENTEEAVIAADADGTIVGTSRPAFIALRERRSLADEIRSAVRSTRAPKRVQVAGITLHLSPCADRALPSGWLIAVDRGAFVEPPQTLTARQEELLGHLEKGLTNAELGAAMNIAAATAKTMLERLYRITGTANRVELLSWARARTRR